jgi:hypothetical protein
MVEQRKSLPQAVPSSICKAQMLVAALRSHNRTSSQGQPSEIPSVRQSISSLGRENGSVDCTYVVAREVVDRGLGQHGVVLELRLPQRRSVASNDDELSLASAEALEGGLVSEGDPEESVCRWYRDAFLNVLSGLHHKRQARVDGVGGSLVLLGCHLCAQECICKVPGGVVALRLSS